MRAMPSELDDLTWPELERLPYLSAVIQEGIISPYYLNLTDDDSVETLIRQFPTLTEDRAGRRTSVQREADLSRLSRKHGSSTHAP